MSFIPRAALAAIGAVALATFAPIVQAHGYKLGDLEIAHPWSRATPPAAKVAGGYLKITNRGSQPDRLIAASFEGSRAAEIHEMTTADGVMRMRELPRGLEIKPGETVELKPGGLHLMFVDLKAGLVEKQRTKGVLVFERAGRVEVEFAVESMGAKGSEHDGHASRTP